MRIIADLHIHSPYARAVSKAMTLENLDYWAGLKGITVMGTGDFTHPKWMKEIKEKLEPVEQGLYKLKAKSEKLKVGGTETRFLLTVEISSIYSKAGKVRRIHNLIFAPTIEIAEKINTQLGWLGNLKSDGRPILGLDSEELAKIVFSIDPACVIVPAHAWTPWFSIFGSMSGFDSIEECFGKFTREIFAIETGLSSDPAMNWRLSKLDSIALISNSDSHSLQRIGREANVFDCELSYDGIVGAIRSRDPKQFLFTVEFFPEEGKYHYD
ncbi:MAG: endonuclease Q family protein, partial [Patescibacteria group bacterium]